MSYSINPILHPYANKKGLHKIHLQVICNRLLIRVASPYKVKVDQFKNGEIINHPNKSAINNNLKNDANLIEGRIIEFLRTGKPTKAELENLVNNKEPAKAEIKFTSFIKSHVDETAGKKTVSTNKGYTSVVPDIDQYAPGLTLSQIDTTWLNLYEKYQRGLGWDENTIHKKMVRIKTMLNRAADGGLIEKSRFEKYKVPVYVQKLAEYISEDEMKAIKDLVDTIKKPVYKMAGYHFLLACYAGYRLSDLKKFDHAKSVKGDKIILRAKKNKVITMMPIHTRLAEIIAFVKDNPINIAEQHLRDYVKEIVKLAGIDRNIKIHTARHSFAMMLMDNGFDLEEVATLLGISKKTAAIYGHISNKRLELKVRTKLG